MLTKVLHAVSQKTFAIAALGLALAGCGRQDSTTVQNPWASNPGYTSGQCGSGYIYNGGWCLPYYTSVTTGFTSSPCYSQQISATQTELVCSITAAYAVGASSVMNFPYLPGAGQTGEAWWGPEVRAGEQIVFEGAFRYGKASLASLFGDCSDERDGSALMKGVVGNSFFSLPMNQTVSMPESGVLRMGMPQRHSCLEYSNLRVRIRRNI